METNIAIITKPNDNETKQQQLYDDRALVRWLTINKNNVLAMRGSRCLQKK